MRSSFPVLVGVFASLAVCSSAAGQTAEEQIITATLRHFETLNAADAPAHVAHHVPGVSAFDAFGGLLYEPPSREAEIADMQAGYDAGFRQNYQLRHLKARVYGDAAVVTAYVVGVDIGPGGSETPVMNRRTAVLVRREGQWLEVHSHQSPVVGAPSR